MKIVSLLARLVKHRLTKNCLGQIRKLLTRLKIFACDPSISFVTVPNVFEQNREICKRRDGLAIRSIQDSDLSSNAECTILDLGMRVFAAVAAEGLAQSRNTNTKDFRNHK